MDNQPGWKKATASTRSGQEIHNVPNRQTGTDEYTNNYRYAISSVIIRLIMMSLIIPSVARLCLGSIELSWGAMGGDGRWAAMVDHRARSPLCFKFWLSNFTCQLTSGASFTMHTPEALNQVQL